MSNDTRRDSVVRNLEDQRGSATKAQVRDYWDTHPLGAELVPYEVGTPEYIDALYARWCETIDEHRLVFLESCRGKKVLEIGCGSGMDSRF
jgi:hypothetical protein